MDTIIAAHGLVKRYGDVTALGGLDLQVPRGTVLGLLGPNGAGKTTAVRILTTLLVPDEGEATIAGVDLRTDPEGVRHKIGLVPSVEVINNASFIVIFPLTFIANTFVDIDSLPGPLRTFALWNPVSSVTQAARELFGNTSPAFPAPDVWSLQHPVAYTLLWVGIILLVFVPLSVRQYKRAASR